MDLIGDAKAASAITCITRSSHPAQNLKLRRLYASGSASFHRLNVCVNALTSLKPSSHAILDNM